MYIWLCPKCVYDYHVTEAFTEFYCLTCGPTGGHENRCELFTEDTIEAMYDRIEEITNVRQYIDDCIKRYAPKLTSFHKRVLEEMPKDDLRPIPKTLRNVRRLLE